MPKKVDKMFLRELRETWDDVNTAGMTEAEALKFRKQKEAVDLYIDDIDMDTIVSRTGIRKPRIHQMVSRCATPTDMGEIPGYNALIPGKILLSPKTKMDIFFEDHPKIGEKIRGTYFGDKAYTSEHRINIRGLHSIFIRECRTAGVQAYEYPFTTKDFGYEALRVYINKVANTEMTKAIKREGKDQRQQFLSTGYGRAITLNPLAPYEQVQADGHILDVIYTVETTGADGVKITDVATRMWLFAIIDIATRCIIGYSVSPYMNYNRFDVLEAVKNSIVPHEHKDFKLKSLSYPDKGGFPSEVIPETKWAIFNTILLDNAKAHQSKIVMDKLTNELKCVVNFGSIATPESRGIVERFFGTLERSGFHRLPNTTGSNPRDLKREDAEKHAKDIKLTYEDMCEILESLIAQYNNSAHSALNGLTPLEMMETKIREARMPFYTLPQVDRGKIEELTHYTVECVLRGGYKKGKQLRVNYMSTTYVAADLMIPQCMANERVLIEIDPSDMRTVKMYRKDGSFFCTMRALGEKGQVRHSFKTLEMSNKARNKRTTPDTIFTPDISLLAEELAERGKTDRRSRTKAAIIAQDAKGALEPKGPAEVIDLYRTEEATPSVQPLRKAAGENLRKQKELSLDEINAIFAKYPGDSAAAIREINKLTKG